ncbi:ImpA family metalloprotease [Vibrio agarivorans]|uniref:ImpA family metalloprotease n=1 Tax=Vibrio agarivorans TaxID=153622 RepID=A0ABT7Y403_9VIBR|nr:ImpA family metalloprotease [Vibrio agarivorans]MDN2482773.1 ImpA family metalloprotease [Vibrio agarivorans]
MFKRKILIVSMSYVLMAPAVSYSDSYMSAYTTSFSVENDILDRMEDYIEKSLDFDPVPVSALFNLNSNGGPKDDGTSLLNVSWDPTVSSAILESYSGFNTPFLFSNTISGTHAITPNELGILGEKEGEKFIVWARNPFFSIMEGDDHNDEFNTLVKNSVDYLINSDSPTVVISNTNNPNFRAIKSWFSDNYDNSNIINGASEVLDIRPDIWVISNNDDNIDSSEVLPQVQKALSMGIPVMYVYRGGATVPNTGLGYGLLDYFDIRFHGVNSNLNAQAQGFNILDLQAREEHIYARDTARKVELVSNVINDNFTFDLALCVPGNSCNNLQSYLDEFSRPVQSVREYFERADRAKLDLYADSRFEFERLLIELADYYRTQLSFPMDKVTTPRSDFLQAQFSDAIVYHMRNFTTVPSDLGNISRTNFDHVSPKVINVSIPYRLGMRSTGAYALPGTTFSVTRTDSDESIETKVKINTVRRTATRYYNQNGYQRPATVTSSEIPLAVGETIELTSPFGGPIQVVVESQSANIGDEVSFRFNHVGQHPRYVYGEDSSAFMSELLKGDYDWVELVTPGFELHSKYNQMLESIAHYDSVEDLAEHTVSYFYELSHQYAGDMNDLIPIRKDLDDWISSNNFEYVPRERVTHANIDLAACGSGCSGNPYDTSTKFDPLAKSIHLHEYGHGREKSALRIDGMNVHASTLLYNNYVQNQHYIKTGIEPRCDNLHFEPLFEEMVIANQSDDPFGHMNKIVKKGSAGDGTTILHHMMLLTNKFSSPNIDGWLVVPKIHVMDHMRAKGLASDEAWEKGKYNLGLSLYTRSEASKMSNNDFLLTSISKIANQDFIPVFDMWGVPTSNLARQNVLNQGYGSFEPEYYRVFTTDYCKTMDFDTVATDGSERYTPTDNDFGRNLAYRTQAQYIRWGETSEPNSLSRITDGNLNTLYTSHHTTKVGFQINLDGLFDISQVLITGDAGYSESFNDAYIEFINEYGYVEYTSGLFSLEDASEDFVWSLPGTDHLGIANGIKTLRIMTNNHESTTGIGLRQIAVYGDEFVDSDTPEIQHPIEPPKLYPVNVALNKPVASSVSTNQNLGLVVNGSSDSVLVVKRESAERVRLTLDLESDTLVDTVRVINTDRHYSHRIDGTYVELYDEHWNVLWQSDFLYRANGVVHEFDELYVPEARYLVFFGPEDKHIELAEIEVIERQDIGEER